MTFLRRYSFSAAGFNFIICAFTVEWALIIRRYLWDWNVSEQNLLTIDFISVSILIWTGAVSGKVNALQLILMSFIEVPIQVVYGYIGVRLLCAFDADNPMYVHIFDNLIQWIFFSLNKYFVIVQVHILV